MTGDRIATRASRAPYHHGALRRALLDAALSAIVAQGPAGVSLREIARTVGVSHSAPRHHFEDKRGLLTAIATEGFVLLGDALEAAWESTHSFLEVGVAYVRFAIDHRAHFEVMFRPDLLRESDAGLLDAQRRTRALLYGPAVGVTGEEAQGTDPRIPALAAWSLVHGLATLWLAGNLANDLGEDPEALARAVARHLF